MLHCCDLCGICHLLPLCLCIIYCPDRINVLSDSQQAFQATLTKTIDINIFINIVHHSEYVHMEFVVKIIYLMAYVSFPRISNLVPAADNFRLQRLSSFEILFALPCIHKFIKWTKFLHSKTSVKILLFQTDPLPL